MRTHCKHGHELTPANTYLIRRADRGVERRCRACHLEQQRKRRAAEDGGFQVLVCVIGDHEWRRPRRAGRPPRVCPEHER